MAEGRVFGEFAGCSRNTPPQSSDFSGERGQEARPDVPCGLFFNVLENRTRTSECSKRPDQPHLRRNGAFSAKFSTGRRILRNFGFFGERGPGSRPGAPCGPAVQILGKILARHGKIEHSAISRIVIVGFGIVNLPINPVSGDSTALPCIPGFGGNVP